MTRPDTGQATHRFFEVSAAGDVDTLRTLVAPGAVIWRNTGQGVVPFDDEFPRIEKLYNRVGAWFYRDIRQTVGESSCCEQHTVVFDRPGKPEVAIEVAVVMHYDEDGLLVRLDEYMNPADLDGLRK